MYLTLAEVVAPIQPPVASTWWEYFLALAITAFIAFAINFLNKWAAQKMEEAALAKEQGKDLLKSRIREALARTVSNIANKELVELKEKAESGKVSKDDLKHLGQEAIARVVCEFKAEGLDIIREFGTQYLDGVVRHEVDGIKEEDERMKLMACSTTVS
jgi:Glu-tRNA(Gln) amidotransferase subunit E-like FAD-binding protein